MSGGEKSLVALAFLFAVFLARPCPFYILDEVEAALDDANIDRFLQLVRRFSDRAQFIIVTHQKRTMDAADCLYGVSMGGDGVSKVVSRKLGAGARRSRRWPSESDAGSRLSRRLPRRILAPPWHGPGESSSSPTTPSPPPRARAEDERAQARLLPPAAREHGEVAPGARRRAAGHASSRPSTTRPGSASRRR